MSEWTCLPSEIQRPCSKALSLSMCVLSGQNQIEKFDGDISSMIKSTIQMDLANIGETLKRFMLDTLSS